MALLATEVLEEVLEEVGVEATRCPPELTIWILSMLSAPSYLLQGLESHFLARARRVAGSWPSCIQPTRFAAEWRRTTFQRVRSCLPLLKSGRKQDVLRPCKRLGRSLLVKYPLPEC